jgi:pantothenate synthetase
MADRMPTTQRRRFRSHAEWPQGYLHDGHLSLVSAAR